MAVSRRGFISGVAAFAGLPRLVRAEETADGFVIIRARIADAKLMGGEGPATKIWSYGEGAAPLILRGRQGEELKYRFINELGRAVTLHWYGVRGPSTMMSLVIEPGEQNAIDCVFAPPDAGTFWFGPVTDSSRLRDMGLYGMLIVAEKDDLQPPFTEVPIVVDDWRISNDGVIDEESFGSLEDAIGQGRLGNWFTVNGAFRPRIEGGSGLMRLRVLNAANVRTTSLVFKGADPWIIALDGQPVQPRPLGTSGVVLAPGQRADLLVDPGTDDITMALNLFEDVAEMAYLTRRGETAAGLLPDNFRLPANPIPLEIDTGNAEAVPLVIEGGEKGGMAGASYQGAKLDLRALLEKGMAWALNGTAGLAPAPWRTFKQGATVLVEIDNRTKFDQPLHLHGHVWRLLDDDKGVIWRDTLVVAGSKRARAVFVADNPGIWGLHSTIAERLDSGLITSFAVSAS